MNLAIKDIFNGASFAHWPQLTWDIKKDSCFVANEGRKLARHFGAMDAAMYTAMTNHSAFDFSQYTSRGMDLCWEDMEKMFNAYLEGRDMARPMMWDPDTIVTNTIDDGMISGHLNMMRFSGFLSRVVGMRQRTDDFAIGKADPFFPTLLRGMAKTIETTNAKYLHMPPASVKRLKNLMLSGTALSVKPCDVRSYVRENYLEAYYKNRPSPVSTMVLQNGLAHPKPNNRI